MTPNITRLKRFTAMLDFHYQYHLSKESAKHLGQLLGCAAKATRWYLKRINTSGMSESNEGPARGQSFNAGPVDLPDTS